MLENPDSPVVLRYGNTNSGQFTFMKNSQNIEKTLH